MNNKQAMKQHVEAMPFEAKDTNTAGALKQAENDIFNPNSGDRSYILNVIIVISDGQSNINHLQTPKVARQLQGISTVYVVAVINNYFNQEELEYITSDPDKDHYFDSPTIMTLPILKCKLLQ